MKRLFGVICVVAVMIAAIALPASAASYTKTTSCDFFYDYTYNLGGSVDYVYFKYRVGFLGGPGAVSTEEYVPTGGTGWVFSYITRQFKGAVVEIEFFSAQDTSITNNKLTCTVSLDQYNDPTKTNHFASRTYNGVSDVWDYYYVSPYHGYGLEIE